MLDAASQQCRKEGAALTVLLIPTAASVCGQAVSPDTLPQALIPILTNETNVRDNLVTALNSKNVFTIDAFPLLLKAVSIQDGVCARDASQLPTSAMCETLASALSQSGSTATN